MLWWPAKAKWNSPAQDVVIFLEPFTITALSKIEVETLNVLVKLPELLQRHANIQWFSEARYTLLTQMTIFGPPPFHLFMFQSFSG